MNTIEIYTTSYCSYCVKAKSLLSQKNIPFQEIDVTNDPEKRTWLQKATGKSTVPQIFIYGKSIGGYTDLAQLDQTGELQSLLSSQTSS